MLAIAVSVAAVALHPPIATPVAEWAYTVDSVVDYSHVAFLSLFEGFSPLHYD